MMSTNVPSLIARLAVFVLVFSVVAGCAGSSSDTTATPARMTTAPAITTSSTVSTTDPSATTTSDLNTTTTLDTTLTVDKNGLHPGPLPGSGGYFGSGCSPGSDAFPDGVWYGFAHEVNPTSITFDLACLRWIPDPNDDEIEEGAWEIVNENPSLRVVPVHPDAQATCDTWGCPLSPFPYAEWIDELPDALPLEQAHEREHGGLAIWLYVNDGVVTEIGQEMLAG